MSARELRVTRKARAYQGMRSFARPGCNSGARVSRTGGQALGLNWMITGDG